jgi:type II secretory pathway component PulF
VTHPGPFDTLWLLGAAFLLVMILAGTLVPLWAALFYRITETSTRLERSLVQFGRGLFVMAMIIVGTFAVGFAIMVMTRVWRLA